MAGIFHYTSNSGAVGIIDSSCIFATNYKYLNDFREVSLARQIVVPILQEEFRKISGKEVAPNVTFEGAVQEYGDQVYELQANAFFDSALKATDNLTPIFISSFCRHEVNSEQWLNGLLSQWRGYGALGGCALEFEENELMALVEEERTNYAHTHVSLLDVVYENHENQLDLREIGAAVEALLRYMAEETPENERTFHERVGPVYKAIALVAPKLKDSAFSEESEVRIVAPCMRPRAAAVYPNRTKREVHFRDHNGIPVPYIRLFEGIDKLPIRRIIIGPQRDQDKVVYALELAAEKKGDGGRN